MPATQSVEEYKRWEVAQHAKRIRAQLADVKREVKLRADVDEARGLSSPSHMTKLFTRQATRLRSELDVLEAKA